MFYSSLASIQIILPQGFKTEVSNKTKECTHAQLHAIGGGIALLAC